MSDDLIHGRIKVNQQKCAALIDEWETLIWDELQRLLNESRSWTGMLPAPGTRTPDRYAYNDLGNITIKDDYADLYTYGSKDRTPARRVGGTAARCSAGSPRGEESTEQILSDADPQLESPTAGTGR